MSNNNRKVINKDIVACQLNINGLSRQTVTALEHFISVNDIKILALQETGYSHIQAVLDNLAGLCLFSNNPSPDTNGVILALHQSLKPQLITELLAPNVDAVWVTGQLNGKTVLFGSVYCLPESDNTNSMNRLLENIKEAKQWSEKMKINGLVVYGDYNARSACWGDTKENERGRKLKRWGLDEDFIICSPSLA